jgi:LPXTG-motif cell wall-anchored protein
MTRAPARSRTGELAGVACIASISMTWLWLAPADASTPLVSITPGGALHDGEAVTVSVGPNSVFTPHAGIHILECADPGGTVANLPQDDSSCDGNTIQPNSVLVSPNGSFSAANYVIYRLPNSVLGEQTNFQPVCNATNPCVLYIGQSQNDFTAPKIFSSPFSVASSSSSGASAPPANAVGSSATSSSASPVPASAGGGHTSAPSSMSQAIGSLAQTGAQNLEWLTIIGAVTLVLGTAGRRIASRPIR